jgi:hypothetical protein
VIDLTDDAGRGRPDHLLAGEATLRCPSPSRSTRVIDTLDSVLHTPLVEASPAEAM